MFCIAAGVATVVALRSLGLAISDSLVSNLRLYNHGDINVSSVPNYGPFAATFQRGADEPSVMPPSTVEFVRRWAEARGGRISAYALVSNIQITALHDDVPAKPQFTSSFFIDPLSFDLAAPIVALEPAGVPLEQLLSGGYEVVISRNLADSQRLSVGDQVRVSGTEQPFTVTGIIPTETEASINNILASFFGFVYFSANQAATMGLNENPNTIGIVLPDGATADEITSATADLTSRMWFREVSATPWLLERNQEIADLISRFIVTMGLGAMLIGGVGIMNTMLVLVGRRSMEIAALKTFGLKGRQISLLFMSEAFLLGVIGSVLGVVVGLLLSGAVNTYGEAFLQQKLPWRLHPEAIVFGVGLGMVVTMVFGVLPVLIAANVRPAIVLRPNESHVPSASVRQVILAIGMVAVVLGVIAGQIIGPVLERATDVADRFVNTPNPTLTGIALVFATVIILALLTGFMWMVVWVLGHLPTLGRVDVRLALRNLSTRRLRTATTLLALTAGMFALSSITYFGLGTREVIRFQFVQTLGGNVMIVPLLPREIAQPYVNLAVNAQEGVESTTVLNLNAARLIRVNGERIMLEEEERTFTMSVMTRDTTNTELNSGPLLAGRDLTEADRGQPVVVLAQQSAINGLVQGFESLEQIGIEVGSTIRMRINGRSLDLEVVGIVGSPSRFTPTIANAYLPPDIEGVQPAYRINVVQVDAEHVNQFLTNLTAVPLLFAVDVSLIDGLLKRLIDQLAAIPTVVGILSLLAAAVIMANTVSLTMLERRQQIGILKAIGLKRGRVLRVVLLENTVIGLLGGLLGIGISSLGVTLLTTIGTGFSIPIPSDATLLTIGLVVASVGIAWLATLLSARVAIRETVAKILRYE